MEKENTYLHKALYTKKKEETCTVMFMIVLFKKASNQNQLNVQEDVIR